MGVLRIMTQWPNNHGSQRRESVTLRIGHYWPGVAALCVSLP
jgi:hypothetical protein